MTDVLVSGPFDDMRSRDIRFLEEAAKLGPVTVALWDDERVASETGRCKFPFAERAYLLEALRFVERVVADTRPDRSSPSRSDAPVRSGLLLAREGDAAALEAGAVVIPDAALAGFPVPPFDPADMPKERKRVIVTGCYDWFHSGHVRFFEECSQLGDLYVVAGHDANVRLLKGEGHPLFPDRERRYIVASCRYVKHALISSGMGWMDAEPEIALVQPHMYAVNEDGDKPEKRAFCAAHGIEYVVLKRTPKEGLPRRSSTDLRGF
jgi:cytidyltransferase-like protein